MRTILSKCDTSHALGFDAPFVKGNSCTITRRMCITAQCIQLCWFDPKRKISMWKHLVRS